MESYRGHVGMTSCVSAVFLEFPVRKLAPSSVYSYDGYGTRSHVKGSPVDDELAE